MTIFKSLTDARDDKPQDVAEIWQIKLTDGSDAYIRAKMTLEWVRRSAQSKLTELEQLNKMTVIRACSAYAVDDTSADELTVFLSARGWGDSCNLEWRGSPATTDQEILAQCQLLLKTGVDVDEREQSDEQILAKIAQARKSFDTPKFVDTIKRGPGYCYHCEDYSFGDCDCGHYPGTPGVRQ